MATTSFTRKEYIDISKLHLLINSNVLLKWDEAQMHIEDETKRYPIINRLKNLESCIYDDSVEITYTLDKYGRYKNTNETGLGFSYTNMFGEIRKILANKYYNDLDIKNCHPVIIYNLCLKHNITKCSYLKKFIENREEILKQIVEDNPDGHMNEARIEGKKMDRDVAKRFLLTFFFGAGLQKQKDAFNITELDEFIENLETENDFFNELQDIIYRINNLACYRDIAKYAKEECEKKGKTNNTRGSIFSRIICDYERQLIDLLTIEMENKGYTIGTYMYDGLFVDNKKDIIKDDIDYFNKKLTDFFNVKNAMPIELTIKPMTNIDNKYLDVDIDYKKYLMLKDKLENKEKVYKIMEPISFYWGKNDNKKDVSNLTFNNKTDLITKYENFGEVNVVFTKKRKFIEAWLNDKYCQTYDSITFNPDKAFNNPKILNKFTGFDIEKDNCIGYDLPATQEERKKYCKTLFDFIYKICNNDDEALRYLLSFISISLKSPNKKIDAMPFFKGKAGTGKTTLFLLIQAIIGKKYCLETSELENTLFSKHSSGRVDKLLILLDEVRYGTSSKYADQLKTCITSDTMTIEPKNINPFRYNSYEKYIGCSNNDIPLLLDENNRRVRIYECDHIKYGTIEEKAIYFANIYKIIGDRDNEPNYKVLRCFYEYMLEYDTDNYLFGANVANDATLALQRDISYSFLDHHLLTVNNQGYIEQISYNIMGDELFKEFNVFKTTSHIVIELTYILFCKKINKYDFVDKKKTSKGIQYIFDMSKYKEYFKWNEIVEVEADEVVEVEM